MTGSSCKNKRIFLKLNTFIKYNNEKRIIEKKAVLSPLINAVVINKALISIKKVPCLLKTIK